MSVACDISANRPLAKVQSLSERITANGCVEQGHENIRKGQVQKR